MSQDHQSMNLPLTMDVGTGGVAQVVARTVESTVKVPPPPPVVVQQGSKVLTGIPPQPFVQHQIAEARFSGSEKENMYNNSLPNEPPIEAASIHQNAARQQYMFSHGVEQTYERNEFNVGPEIMSQYVTEKMTAIYPPTNPVEGKSLEMGRPNVRRRSSSSSGRRRRSTDDQGVILDLHPVFYSVGLTVFSALILIQSVVDCAASDEPNECDKGSYILTIIVSNLTIIMAFIIPIIWLFFVDSDRSVKRTADTLCPWFSIIIAVFWIITTPLVTYNHPYKISGNGYFFAWAMFCIAVYFAKDVNEEFKNYLGKITQILVGNRFDRTVARTLILISLFFVVSAVVNFIGNSKNVDENSWESWFVVIVGLFCFLSLLVYEVVIAWLGLYQEDPVTDEENPSVSLEIEVEPPMQVFSILLVVLWFAIAILSTFSKDSPFKIIGNGYFASWASAFGSLLLLLTVYGFVDQEGVV